MWGIVKSWGWRGKNPQGLDYFVPCVVCPFPIVLSFKTERQVANLGEDTKDKVKGAGRL